MFKVPPERLHEFWPKIQAGLFRVKQRSNDLWILEDVYTALKTGSAHLMCDEHSRGFLIFNLVQDFDSRQHLHVWCAYGKGVDPEEGMEQLEGLAKELNCASITFFSPRRGWARNRLGFEEVHTLYRKRL